jgi:hypothetical protein
MVPIRSLLIGGGQVFNARNSPEIDGRAHLRLVERQACLTDFESAVFLRGRVKPGG